MAPQASSARGGSVMIIGICRQSSDAPSQDDGRSTPVAFLQRYGREIGLPIIVIAMVIFFSINSDVFLSLSNFRNIGVSAAALAAVSFGQTFAILTAGLDLSVGAIVALVSIVGALVMRDHGVAGGAWPRRSPPALPSASSTESSLHASRCFRSSPRWR